MKTKSKYKRDRFKAIILSELTPRIKKEVYNLVKTASDSDKVDGHKNWEFGAEFDRKGRGSALNWSLYDVGSDIHNRKRLIVIQVRQFIKNPKRQFANIRKSYFLIGRNEDNSVFAHPVESRVIHHAISKGNDVIKSVQDWIFGCDYTKIQRQGDIAVIPVRKNQLKGDIYDNNEYKIKPENGSDNHFLQAYEIMIDESKHCQTVFANNPFLQHLPGVHPDIKAKGWHKIIIGKRANFYDFAAPTID